MKTKKSMVNKEMQNRMLLEESQYLTPNYTVEP